MNDGMIDYANSLLHHSDNGSPAEPRGTSECPVCGKNTPHPHSQEDLVERIVQLKIYGKIADAQVAEIANLQKRISEFDACIQKVAEALGAVCGGVDGNQKDVHATTAVLLRHIEKLKSQAVTGQGDANGGWLPINSAPYNKTRVALIHSDGKGYVRYGVGWYMPLTGWQGWDGGDNYLQPTHWHPIPAAPMTAASGMDEGNNVIELRWVVSKRNDTEPVLQYRTAALYLGMDGNLHIQRDNKGLIYTDWITAPTVTERL